MGRAGTPSAVRLPLERAVPTVFGAGRVTVRVPRSSVNLSRPLVHFIARFLMLLVSCALPAVASAQAWRNAHQAGDYAKATHLLYQIVSDQEHVLRGGDPDAFRLLATMYRDGLGVPRDPIAACALAQDAEHVTLMTPPARPMQTMDDALAYQALQTQAHDFSAAVCGALSGVDLLAAGRSRGGCYGFGMPEETITLGSQSVQA